MIEGIKLALKSDRSVPLRDVIFGTRTCYVRSYGGGSVRAGIEEEEDILKLIEKNYKKHSLSWSVINSIFVRVCLCVRESVSVQGGDKRERESKGESKRERDSNGGGGEKEGG
jgi:hypothetical protein